MAKRKPAPRAWPLSPDIWEVEWADSTSFAGWGTTENYKGNVFVKPLRSCGYLLQITEEFVTLVQSMCEPNGHVAESITIPRPVILKMSRIKREP